jgi:DNA methylase
VKKRRWLGAWWKMLPRRWGHPWHSMCSYLAMFPPALPRYFIEQCSVPGDTVLDPFSGRGTTALEACLADRVGLGSDANPLAFVLTHAKVNPPAREDLDRRLAQLRLTYRPVDSAAAPPEIRMIFDGRRTLPQLLYIRSALRQSSRTDVFLLAVLAGILHGNHTKDPHKSRTLSITMPNTFAMSPAYIRRYIRRKRLKKYPFDVFDLLEKRIKHLFARPLPLVRGAASQRDARSVREWLPRDSVNLVVTSPPYLNVVRYGKFNWIRLWLLGDTVAGVDNRLRVEASDRSLKLSDRLSLTPYGHFIEECLIAMSSVLSPGAYCAVVVGDVQRAGTCVNLAAEVWHTIRRSAGLKLVDIIEDPIVSDTKVTRIWAEKRGLATTVDRVLLLRKPGPFRRARRPQNILRRLNDAAHPLAIE